MTGKFSNSESHRQKMHSKEGSRKNRRDCIFNPLMGRNSRRRQIISGTVFLSGCKVCRLTRYCKA